MARRMIKEWGMSQAVGPINYSSGNETEEGLIGGDMFTQRPYSEATAREIDEEVRRVLDQCHAKARDLLAEHRTKLEALAEALLVYEVLDADEARQIVAGKPLSRAVTTVVNAPADTTPMASGAEPGDK